MRPGGDLTDYPLFPKRWYRVPNLEKYIDYSFKIQVK